MGSGDRAWVDDMAIAYERWLVPAIFEPCADDLVARIATARPRDVLEIAAGTGVVTGRLVAALSDAVVTATDLNPAMVEEGRRNAPRATWQQADALDLPYEDESFDVVACQFGVMFFPDRLRALTEAQRVLRPGGRLLSSSWDAVERNPFPAAVEAGVRRALPDDPPSFLRRIPYAYHDLAEIEADARAGGFGEAHAERRKLDGRSPSALDVVKGFCRGTPLRAEIEGRGDLDAIIQLITDEVTSLLGSGPVTGPLAFVVLEAVKAP